MVVKIKQCQLSDFLKNDRKNTNSFLMNQLKSFIKKYGQFQNIVVYKKDDLYYVIAGVEIFLACKELDYEEIDIKIIDIKDEKEALLFSFWDKFQFEYDSVNIADKVCSLLENYEESEITRSLPYTQSQIDIFKKLYDFDWNDYNKATPIVEQREKRAFF